MVCAANWRKLGWALGVSVAVGCGSAEQDSAKAPHNTSAVQQALSPTGALDATPITCDGYVKGWTQDPDAPTATNSVHFYRNGQLGTGTPLGFPRADGARTDSHNGHGFSWRIPDTAAASGTLYAYGSDISGSNPATLLNSAGTLYQAYTISGSTGVVGATVTVSGSSLPTPITTTSDGTKQYSVRVFCPGTYTVTITRTACAFSPASQNVIVGPNATANFTETNCALKIKYFGAIANSGDPGLVGVQWLVEGTPTNSIYVYDLEHPKNPFLATQPATGNVAGAVRTQQFHVKYPGMHRYTIAATDGTTRLTFNASVDVPSPGSPTITSTNPRSLDMSVTGLPAIQFLCPNNGFVRISEGGDVLQDTPVCANAAGCNQSYTPPTPSPFKLGGYDYVLQYCRYKATSGAQQSIDPSDPVYCGPAVTASFMHAPAKFVRDQNAPAGSYRNYFATPPTANVGVSWTGGPSSNTTYKFRSPTTALASLNPGTATTFQIPYASLACPAGIPAGTPCLHDLVLVTCYNGKCSDEESITMPLSGKLVKKAADGAAVLPCTPEKFCWTPVAEVRDATTNALLTTILSNWQGIVQWVPGIADNTFYNSGTSIAQILTDNNDHKQFIVGAQPWQSKSHKTDFNCSVDATNCAKSYPVFKHSLAGLPLDVLNDGYGNFWSMGEFNEAIMHVSADTGTLEVFDVPLRRQTQGGYELKVKPFSYNNVGSWTARSILGEKIHRTPDGVIWFSQGGELMGPASGNRSRVGSFNPNAQDNPATEYDDRFCMYNIPGDGNEAVGIASIDNSPSGNRIFFGEGGYTGLGEQGHLRSFQVCCPVNRSKGDTCNPLSCPSTSISECANDKDPSTQPSVCANGSSGGDCFSTINVTRMINAFSAGVFVAHLWVDGFYTDPNPAVRRIWFTDYRNGIGKVDVNKDSGTAVAGPQLYSFAQSSSNNSQVATYGSQPWQIRDDASYVYVMDYQDDEIVRVSKANPSAQETKHLPVSHAGVRGHSIDIANGRLWFTLAYTGHSVEQTRVSSVGYIDLTSTTPWATRPGVVYDANDLGNVTDPSLTAGAAHFAGLGVSNGSVVFTDFLRKQLIWLPPKT